MLWINLIKIEQNNFLICWILTNIGLILSAIRKSRKRPFQPKFLKQLRHLFLSYEKLITNALFNAYSLFPCNQGFSLNWLKKNHKIPKTYNHRNPLSLKKVMKFWRFYLNSDLLQLSVLKLQWKPALLHKKNVWYRRSIDSNSLL